MWYQDVVYEIVCNKCPSSSYSALCEEPCGRSVTFIPSQTDLKHTYVIIHGLDQNTEYYFRIYSKNYYSDRINKTNWKYNEKKIKTKEDVAYSKSKTPEIIATAVGVGVIIFLLVIFVVVILCRRRQSASAAENAAVSPMALNEQIPARDVGQAQSLVQQDDPAVPMVVEPTVQASQAPQLAPPQLAPPQELQGLQSSQSDSNALNSTRNLPEASIELERLHNPNTQAQDWEIPPNDLQVLDKNLGAGLFGVVKQGLYKPKNCDPENVAVKGLRENASKSELSNLLAEMEVLKEANKEQHPNIVRFIGSCFLKERLLMVTEFCPGGNLRKFLIKSRISDNSTDSHNIYTNMPSMLSDHQLLKIAVDVACGMVHLSSQQILHRDLAARNILIGEHNVAKICDFGLARNVGSAAEYMRNTQNLLPVKWMSVESLFYGIFTTASDVWSFGVLLYEITTLGEEPYKNILPRAVITHVESGGRMAKPPHCSEEIYEIMSKCWKADPRERPTFPEMLQALRSMLNDNKHTYINVTQVEDGLQTGAQPAVIG
ncbi:proto-oncogene tyrosine-protein kinase receptor Ret-like [Dendronephthya gigantea]|uniref:proto-oncogene tyrosine-protein kinase receptor Ret-like n=1 Tax=Dendronephthya gigantea TaxID=151771 RepID=UPI00106A113E|nr:proto-oncogene tyrosine-protein kinase receptor Ret-like [Dendronephthya gigantea]